MKKLISIIIALSVVTVCIITSATAEEFSLRNGVFFGDSMETVKSKENLAESQYGHGSNFLKYQGTLAGIEGGMLLYNFDDDLKLYDVEYRFSGLLERDALEYYPLLFDGLEKKYGSSLGNTGGIMFPITTGALETIEFYIARNRSNGSDNAIDNYAEWVIECDGYFVKIDLISYHIKGNGKNSYGIGLGYCTFTEKELEDASTKIATDEL